MQINLIIQALIHLFKQVFIDYLIVRSEGERNQCFCKPSIGSGVWWGIKKVSEKWFLYFKKLKIYLKNGYINSKLEDGLLPDRKNLR